MFNIRNYFYIATQISAGRPKAPETRSNVNRIIVRHARMFAAVAAIGLSLALPGCGTNTAPFSTSSNTAGGLVINPSAVDFGAVNVGNSANQTLLITNNGTSAMRIEQLSTSDSAFAATAGSLPATLPGGGSLSVQIKYDPGSTTDSTGQLSVRALTNTSVSVTGSVKLHGKGSSSTLSLSGLSCAKSSMIGAGTDTCTVVLNGAAPTNGVVINLTSTNSAVSVPVSVIVAAGAKNVSFTANVSAVTSLQTATLTATQGTTSKSTSISLGSATSSSPSTPSLTALSCATSSFAGAGSTACTVTLSSAAPSGGTGVTLVSSTSAVTVPTSVTVASGASSASFSATVSSVTTSQTATLSASSNASSKSFAIQLNAAVPALSASATSLVFGNVSVGTAVTKSVTLTSSGTAPVTISADSISGTGFSVTGGNFPATVNPGQAAVLTVQFSPTSANSVTGQLTLTSNAPAVAVTLSGTGTAVAPTVSAISCNSTSITGALGDSCTVSLSGSAPTGGVVVSLGSNSSAVAVPASVAVPATATSATFTANVASVASAQSATLTATTGTTSRTVALQLNAAKPALTVNASSVSFGDVIINNSTTQTLTLTSSGTAAVTVNSIAVTGSGFSASTPNLPATLNPGQSLNLTLIFDPTAVGAASGQLAISSSSSTVTVSLSGTGDPHQVDLSWTAPAGSSVPITGYNVYRAASGTGAYALLSSLGAQTSYVDTTVQTSQTYDYIVKSLDSAGVESSPSNTTTVTVP